MTLAARSRFGLHQPPHRTALGRTGPQKSRQRPLQLRVNTDPRSRGCSSPTSRGAGQVCSLKPGRPFTGWTCLMLGVRIGQLHEAAATTCGTLGSSPALSLRRRSWPWLSSTSSGCKTSKRRSTTYSSASTRTPPTRRVLLRAICPASSAARPACAPGVRRAASPATSFSNGPCCRPTAPSPASRALADGAAGPSQSNARCAQRGVLGAFKCASASSRRRTRSALVWSSFSSQLRWKRAANQALSASALAAWMRCHRRGAGRLPIGTSRAQARQLVG